jgi:hypothetical protein
MDRLEVGVGKSRQTGCYATAPIRGPRSKRALDIVFLAPHPSGKEILSSLTDLYREVAILARDRYAFQPLPADRNTMRWLTTFVQFKDQSMGFI